jgi:hypothetical protein
MSVLLSKSVNGTILTGFFRVTRLEFATRASASDPHVAGIASGRPEMPRAAINAGWVKHKNPMAKSAPGPQRTLVRNPALCPHYKGRQRALSRTGQNKTTFRQARTFVLSFPFGSGTDRRWTPFKSGT